MNTLCIIPARGGSKGVKRKNIKYIAGKPLIAYSIECARESELSTYFVVSTEDAEIAGISTEWNAPVVMRPADLAKDETPMFPVMIHALEYLEKEKHLEFDLVVLLQATSPIRTGKDVDAVIKMFEEDSSLDGVISVVELNNMHASKMYHVRNGGWMEGIAKVPEAGNRQDLPAVYYRNGCIYAVRTSALVAEQTIMVTRKKAYVMPAEWWANIDDEKDFQDTETLLQLWNKHHRSSNGVLQTF